MTKCPNCNQEIIITVSSRGPQPSPGWSQYQTYQTTDSPFGTMQQPQGDFYKHTPIGRLQSGDILTTLFDSVVVFTIVTIAATGISYLAEVSLLTGPVVGFIAAAARYLYGMSSARNLLSIIENFTMTDDIPQQPQSKQSHTVHVKVKDDKGNWQFSDIQIEPSRLQEFARDCLSGKSFSERTAKINNITQDAFRNMRDQFIDRGWAEYNHPTRKQQGVSLSRNGRSVLRAISNSPLPHQQELG